MTEVEKIKYAKSFIDSLAEGINPLNGLPIPDGEVANQVRISRCFSYVSGLLDRLIEYTEAADVPEPPYEAPPNDCCEVPPELPLESENTASETESKDERPRLLKPFFIEERRLEQVPRFDYAVSLGALVARLNGFADLDECKRLSHSDVTEWLISLGLMQRSYTADGRFRRVPTASGEKLGLDYVRCKKDDGEEYDTVLYSPSAQGFIIKNLTLVTAFLSSGGKERAEVAAHEERQAVLEALKAARDSEKAVSEKPNEVLVEAFKPEAASKVKESKNIAESFKPGGEEPGLKYKCLECKHCRVGDCFGTEPCEDFEPAYVVPKEERDAWPEYGDATMIAERVRREKAAKSQGGSYM